MIASLDKHPAGACFAELNDALVALGRGDTVLNAHVEPEAHAGKTIWHFENDLVAYPGAKEVWTFSEAQAKETGWRYVPVGWHRSMERFRRTIEPDIDIVFMGCLNERRLAIFNELSQHDLRVALIAPGIYGMARDLVLARAKLCVVPLYYPDGHFCTLRAAHLVANMVPCLFEEALGEWPFVESVKYERLVGRSLTKVKHVPGVSDAYDAFRRHPLELPT